MADFKETCVDYLDVDPHATFCSAERRWVNKILKLKESYPDEVNITAHPENNDGIIVAHIPKKWLKISPPRQVNYTEEQRAAAAERLASARPKRES